MELSQNNKSRNSGCSFLLVIFGLIILVYTCNDKESDKQFERRIKTENKQTKEYQGYRTCSYCSKEFELPGHYKSEWGCLTTDKDVSFGLFCSEKCCEESSR